MKTIKGWMLPDRDHHFHEYLREHPVNIYQQKTLDKARKHFKNYSCAIDVGANIGLHSTRLSGMFEEVYSFEPSSENFECLEKNTEMLSNVTISKVALGAEETTEVLSIPVDAENCGVGSFVDFKDKDLVLDNEVVEVKKLDDYNLAPDFIKIDTQGYELEVLKGAEQTLINHSPVILAECVGKEEINAINVYLRTMGYQLSHSGRKDKIWTKQK